MMEDKFAKRSRIQSKKSIKHLLERQRRARINNSLNELKDLVLSAIHQGNPQANINGTEKMEKAEILELTVNYIKAIKGHTNPDVDITEVWKKEDKDVLKKRTMNCYECYEDERKTKVKKSRRSVSHTYFPAYGTGALSPANCHIAQCSPCNTCMDGTKIMCSCYASTMYGITTPPPSPSIECSTVYDEPHGESSASMAKTLSTSNGSATMAVQVWRPWLK